MGWFAAILSGILAGFSYPARFGPWILPDLGFFAFFCWVPLFWAVRAEKPMRCFWYGFVAALFHFSIAQFWLYTAVHKFGGLSPLTSVLVLILLLFALSGIFGCIFLISQWVSQCLNLPLWLIRPPLWVALEFMRHFFPLGGYPWSQMAYTQGDFLTFIQSADLWGSWGLTYLLVTLNEGIALLGGRLVRLEKKRGLGLAYAFCLLITNLSYGIWRWQQAPRKVLQQISVGVVQGNIPQEEKWNRQSIRNIIRTYQLGTVHLEEKGAQLILWPEASFPITVIFDLEKLSVPLGAQTADVLIGSITRSQNFRGNRRSAPVYNSALLISRDGKILDYYHKKKLVPFGEYVPLQEFLFFADKLTAAVGRLQAGEYYRPLQYGLYQLGVLICYEDIFPHISRIMVDQGANVLVNITNDAWYGWSSAPYQHQVYSQLRAVETRRELIRATNTGISSQIDPYGRILWQGGLFVREDFLTELSFYDGKTFFVKYGYIFPWICSIFGLLGMTISGFQARKIRLSNGQRI